MVNKKRIVLLFSLLLLCVSAFVLPVCAEEEPICTGSDCDEFFDDESGIYVLADGTEESVTLNDPVDSEDIGLYLAAKKKGKIKVSANSLPVYGVESGIAIETEDSGSSVEVTAGGIESDGTAIEIAAGSDTTVNVTNESHLNGYTAFYASNQGGTVSLKSADIQGVVGVFVDSSAGSTTIETGNINVEEYGVAVELSDEDKDIADTGNAPKVTVTVNGNITDNFVFADDGSGIDVPDDPEESAVLKAANDENDGWEVIDINNGEEFSEGYDGSTTGEEVTGDDLWDINWNDVNNEPEINVDDSSEPVNSTGVAVSAGVKDADVTVTVNGQISMEYGNEVEAFDGAKVNVTVTGNVETDYGNRIAAWDKGEAVFTFGKDILAGGKAIDTYADSGKLNIVVSGMINAQDTDGDFETIGIYSNSEESAETSINITKGIKVSSSEQDYIAYGIVTDNIGGEINIEVLDDVTVSGNEAIGISVLNDPDESAFIAEDEKTDGTETVAHAAEVTGPKTTITVNGNVTVQGSAETTGMETWNDDGMTTVEVYGDLTGSTYGLDIHAFGDDKNSSFTDILVTETISGKKAGVIVNDEADNDGTDNDNLNLTVWKIELSSGNAAQDENGNANQNVEMNIKYIVKIAPDSEDKITVEDEDGEELQTSHDFWVQKQGQKVYLKAKDGYELTAAYNGKDKQTSLEQDENGRFFLSVPKGGAVWLSVNKAPEPVIPPNSIDFYPIGDLSWLFGVQLPATGFSSTLPIALPAKPQDLSYGSTGLMLQIPELDVMEEIVTVPEIDGNYPVQWLGSAAGLLDQSSLPGEGITILTGHNHLNTAETGPFLLIGSLENNSRIMITADDAQTRTYRVYGNYKIASDGFAGIAGDVHENSLVLITCEDETIDGGYLNRRVILAEPIE